MNILNNFELVIANFLQSFSFTDITFFLLIFLLLTDGFKVIIEIIHRAKPRPFTSNPEEVTALIACHNSASVLQYTLEDLQHTLSNDRIIVVDDGSTDNTSEIANKLGVRVYRFEKNKGKVCAINFGIYRVSTKYTLILDDDTRIGNASLPTSLLDAGYNAVAFSVLPCRRSREITNGRNLLSCLQRYEYGKSMEIGKRFQDATLSVSCVSGAAGLFLTERLNAMHHLHSTIFAGEDLERTIINLLHQGKVAFVDENIWTIVPDNLKDLTSQRLYNWGPGYFRNFGEFFKLLKSKGQPARLKFEMAYNLYVIVSDPLKIYSLILLLFYQKWTYLIAIYLFYMLIELYPFIVVEKKLPMWKYYLPAYFLYPAYGFYNTFLRFLSVFVWLWGRFFTKKMKHKGSPEDRID